MKKTIYVAKICLIHSILSEKYKSKTKQAVVNFDMITNWAQNKNMTLVGF